MARESFEPPAGFLVGTGEGAEVLRAAMTVTRARRRSAGRPATSVRAHRADGEHGQRGGGARRGGADTGVARAIV